MGVPPGRASWIHKISGDLEDPDELVFLVGYWGESSVKSSIEDYYRFYFSPSLKHYIDVPRSAIRMTMPVPHHHSVLEAQYSWIEADAQLIFGPVEGPRLIATYAEGLAWCQGRGLLLDVLFAEGELHYRVGLQRTSEAHC